MEHAQLAKIGLPEDTLRLVTSRINYIDQQNWIPWAWAALARAGDVPAVLDQDDFDYPAHLITLAALGHLFERFHDVFSGTDGDDEVGIELDGIDRPEITSIEIGRYAERCGIYDTDHPETAHGILQAAIFEQTEFVRKRLLAIIGDGRLFTSLVVAARSTPLVDDDYTDHCGEDGSDTAEGTNAPEPIGALLTLEAFDEHMADALTLDPNLDHPRTYEWLTN